MTYSLTIGMRTPGEVNGFYCWDVDGDGYGFGLWRFYIAVGREWED